MVLRLLEWAAVGTLTAPRGQGPVPDPPPVSLSPGRIRPLRPASGLLDVRVEVVPRVVRAGTTKSLREFTVSAGL